MRGTEFKMNKMDEFYQSLTKIYDKLEDQESKTIFRGRTLNNLRNDDDYYYDMLQSQNKTYKFQGESSPYFKKHPWEERRFILFGGGTDYKRYLRTLRIIGYDAAYVCDNNTDLHGRLIDGVLCISFERLLEIWQDFYIIISTVKYKSEIYTQLIQAGVSADNIHQTASQRLVAWNNEMYFRDDIFRKDDNEIYVDGGAFIGDTIETFTAWNPGYKKIYAFEPEKVSFDMLVSKARKDNIVCVNAGLGRECCETSFRGDRGHGQVDTAGNDRVSIVSLDEVVGKDRVTMIKMDIEGSELEALKGARKTIIRSLPKLAICLYHKKEDFYEIPIYVNSIAPQYKLYIRNISADLNDLILYATP